jgi:hypothetical protein
VKIVWQNWLYLDQNVPIDNNQPNQLVTPVITAAQGSTGNGGFYCAWSKSDNHNNALASPHYIQPAYISIDLNNNNILIPNVLPLNPLQAEQTARMSIFPTVAARDESSMGDNLEYLHLSWEEQWDPELNGSIIDTNSQIYYAPNIYHTNLGLNANAFSQTWQIERVSKNAMTCKNTHPNISTDNMFDMMTIGLSVIPGNMEHGEPIVTWEMKYADFCRGCPISYALHNGQVYVMVRERLLPGAWSSFTALYPKQDNIPLPVIKTLDCEDVHGRFGRQFGIDQYGLLFQDLSTSQIHIYRQYFAFDTHSILYERGLYPNSLLTYLPDNNANGYPTFNSFMIRGNDKDENGLYAVKITALSVGYVEKSLPDQLLEVFDATPNECEKGLKYSIARGVKVPNIIGGPHQMFSWTPRDITGYGSAYYSDSNVHVYNWPRTEDSIRTNNLQINSGDSVQLGRIFEISDSSVIGTTYFSDTTHYLAYEVDLKDSASHVLIQTIDSVAIHRTTNGISISGLNNVPIYFNLDSTGLIYSFKSNLSIPLTIPPSGEGYLTIKIRKDTLTPFILVQTQVRVDSNYVMGGLDPIDSISYKKSAPTPTLTSVSNIRLIIHPNPFRTQTSIELEVPKEVMMNVSVFDVLGRQVTNLFSNYSDHNNYNFTLDSKQLNPGMYYVRVQCGGEVVTRKIELLK